MVFLRPGPAVDGSTRETQASETAHQVFTHCPRKSDAVLFYVEFWVAGPMKMPLPADCAAHYAWMKARPAVARTLSQEGLAV